MPSIQPPASALHVAGVDITAHIAAGGGGAVIPDLRACLLWAECDGALLLSRLAVAPEHRGQGLALRLVAEAEREAFARGLSQLTLFTRLALVGNRRLFAKAGFIEREHHTHPGFTTPTFVKLEKSLSSEPGASPNVIVPELDNRTTMFRSVKFLLLALVAGLMSSAAYAQPYYRHDHHPIRHYYHHHRVVVVHRDEVRR